jgi:2-amino-4-hydroxy-6-hydroxymethyldihydropteridine diphosphokinase
VNAFVGFGSNVGDRMAHINGAVAAIGRTPGVTVRLVSSLHETEPIGGPPGQGMFLNAVALLETQLEPVELLCVLQQIEVQFGRERTVRCGERTLDLDLLLFDDRVLQTAELCVPHPRMRTRRFVLEPLVEVGPEAVDPETHRPFAEILAELKERSV